MKYFVTGGAGFIGSNLVDRLLADGNSVTVYDNFSTGSSKFLFDANEKYGSKKLNIIEGELLDIEKLTKAMKGDDFVFHLAANADVRRGTEHPEKDLTQNTIGTFKVLEAMRINNIKKIAFSSTGSVYGESPVIPTPENVSFPIQTSLYGASKVAGEALIQAYCEGFGMQAWIFRFVSILGKKYSHGHIFDFYKQLLQHPDYLDVLGDGTQRKSYLNIKDCINAMIIATNNYHNKQINIYNLGTDEYIEVIGSINTIGYVLGVSPKINYSGGNRGWVGDNPFIFLDCTKIRNLGWKPKYTIRESIEETVEYLNENKWLLGVR
jgi:UDP-glucose 4-epimerase